MPWAFLAEDFASAPSANKLDHRFPKTRSDLTVGASYRFEPIRHEDIIAREQIVGELLRHDFACAP